MEPRHPPPYWLTEGTEPCDVCASLHIIEMQRRCVACDRGLCERCSVHVRQSHEVLCGSCHADYDEVR